MKRVVITGMGAVSPIGNDVDTMWVNAKNGVCGIDKITAFDNSNMKVKLAAEVKINLEDVLDKKQVRRMARFTALCMVAAKEAFTQSKLDMQQEDPLTAGTIIATGIGGLEILECIESTLNGKSHDKLSPLAIPMVIPNTPSGAVSIEYGLQGGSMCISSACASGTNAIGEAFRKIRDGYEKIIIAGGTEAAITPTGIGAFTAMRALSETEDKNRASIPFDKERNGFVMGEGAGIMVLEEYEHAVARNADILGEIIGYGISSDAYHITAPAPEGRGSAQSIRMAIKDAGIELEAIQYINAHGTSTALNDKCETEAIKGVFGDYAYKIPVSSTKSMTGHLIAGGGAIEAILTAKMLQEGYILPTINYKVPDEECDLDIVPNVGRKADITVAMSNSLGFGGHNATIILKKF